MSFLRSSFSIRKAKPRKVVSRSPLKLPADELAREFGSQYQVINARVGDQKLVFDTTHGDWITGNIYLFNYFIKHSFLFVLICIIDGIATIPVSAREMSKLDKKKRDLEEDNNVLRMKLDILLEMLAEVTAEQELRRVA